MLLMTFGVALGGPWWSLVVLVGPWYLLAPWGKGVWLVPDRPRLLRSALLFFFTLASGRLVDPRPLLLAVAVGCFVVWPVLAVCASFLTEVGCEVSTDRSF